ncbi:MAG TPA: hypothetical protein VLF66_05180 [Thermoanaerobaculia bacterium]|nr:hypothetical protein [Thermoanaerobaculia bacterium]
MPDVHLTFELLAARERGDLGERDFLWFLGTHLAADCHACHRELVAHLREEERRAGREPGADAPATEAGTAPAGPDRALEEEVRRFLDERSRGRAEARELVALVDAQPGPDPRSVREALALVRRARTRFRSPWTGFALVEEARESLPDRPRRALALALLAEAVADRVPAPRGGSQVLWGALAGLALAHQGNARRALDDLPGAHRLFARARVILDEAGVANARVLAEVDALEGSLRRDQRRFPQAERLLRRAAAHWTAADEPLGLARALLTLGVLYQQWSRAAEALGAAEAALAALPADAPRRLRLCAEHNRVDYLCDLGHPDVAAELLEAARPLYPEFDDPWTRLRLAWVEGRIAAGLGDLETARERLGAAREGFAAAGSLYDTALVSLELAEAELAAGRPGAARRLAAETVELFAALEVPREAAAALAQLRRASRAEEALTAALLRRALRALRSARPA